MFVRSSHQPVLHGFKRKLQVLETFLFRVTLPGADEMRLTAWLSSDLS